MRTATGKTETVRNLVIEGDEDLPLYKRLHRTIARRIADSHWKPGDILPSEIELARSYGVAPGTIRKAIDALEEDGLIERRHGSGTFIRRPNFDNMMLRFFMFRDQAGEFFLPESHILSREVMKPDKNVAAALRLQEDDMVIKIVRHRAWEGAPRLLEDIFLPFDRFETLLNHTPEEIGPLLYPAYERLCGELICFIEEEITILDALPNDAQTLNLANSELVVAIKRLARDASGHPVEWRISRGEARRFRYNINLR